MGGSSNRIFLRQFVVPVVIVITTTLAALFTLFYLMVTQQNALARQRERAQIEAAVASRTEFIRQDLSDYMRSNDAVDYLAAKLGQDVGQDWANANLGPHLYHVRGYDHCVVIAPDGETLYASDGPHGSQTTAKALLKTNLTAILARLNSAPMDVADRFAVLIEVDGTPAIVAASPILQGADKPYAKAVERRYLLVVEHLNSTALEDIAKNYNVAGLRIMKGREPRPEQRPHVELTSDLTGKPIAKLTWNESRPGNTVWNAYLPWLIIIALNAILLSGFMLIRARRATLDLDANVAAARHLANHDTLTGLPNRRAMMAHGAQLASNGEPTALLYIDLDGFKEVNDLFGHQAGDLLLTEATHRLLAQVGDNGMLARVGGDEFAVTMSGADSHVAAPRLAAAIVDALSKPFTANHINMIVSGSVGVALGHPHDGIEELARFADIAMYAAKAEGRNCWRMFEPRMTEGRDVRKLLEAELREAIRQGSIDVMFQPIVRSSDHEICSLEALARWTSPSQGPIGPAVFVSIAEESGQIVALGERVLRRACEAAADWDIDIAVNLSPAQFWHQGLVTDIVETLRETGFPAHRLELEITEGYLVSRPELAEKVINALRSHGIRIALDDFGTGFASIGYLRRFPIDRIKLDRSFVKAVHRDHDAAAVVHAVIALSRALRLPMTAEGVESQSQAIMLRTAGCERLQGWCFGYPMSSEAVTQRLRERRENRRIKVA